jgi:hypothetical protein
MNEDASSLTMPGEGKYDEATYLTQIRRLKSQLSNEVLELRELGARLSSAWRLIARHDRGACLSLRSPAVKLGGAISASSFLERFCLSGSNPPFHFLEYAFFTCAVMEGRRIGIGTPSNVGWSTFVGNLGSGVLSMAAGAVGEVAVHPARPKIISCRDLSRLTP